MSQPHLNPAGYSFSSVLPFINARKQLEPGRLLLLHGAADENVLLQHSLVLADALIKHQVSSSCRPLLFSFHGCGLTPHCMCPLSPLYMCSLVYFYFTFRLCQMYVWLFCIAFNRTFVLFQVGFELICLPSSRHGASSPADAALLRLRLLHFFSLCFLHEGKRHVETKQ